MRLLPERLEAPAAGIASVINGSLVAARQHGGQILLHPGTHFGRVFLPLLVSWLAGLGATAVFLAAYAIPDTFHTVMAVSGGNSWRGCSRSVTSRSTPGGGRSWLIAVSCRG